jgi:hypothetical protein
VKTKRKRDRYFQEIAYFFLHERGAPFFLSSKDLDLISTWEKMGIPLKVVLEGVKRTFENQRIRPRLRGKIHSLAFCKLQVIKAFEQYKERKIGIHTRKYDRDEKRRKIKEEVQKFLSDIPLTLSYLEDIYARALKILSRKELKEEELEQIEEEIEELLFRHSPEKDKELARKEILEKYSARGGEEFHSIVKLKLVKYLREKYRIPYISLFYY